MNKEIEIPFGAKDSELKGWEYTIPENMEAEIKDGKVIVKKKESEDERIRKILIHIVKGACDKYGIKYKGDEITEEKLLAYLEKQKEPKLESCDCSRDEESYTNGIHHVLMNPEAYGLIKQQPAEQLSGIFTSYDMAKTFTEGQNYVIAHPEKFGLCKPAEWGEEDAGMLNCIIATLCEESHGGREANEKMVTWLENRLKSLRPQPHWKPTEWNEEEKKVLDSIIDDYEKAAKSFCGYDGKIMLLKAIRDGEYDLPKQEWSDEDKKILYEIIRNVSAYDAYTGTTYQQPERHDKKINFLRTLHPSWKPSEEQMEALKDAFRKDGGNEYRKVINSLYCDLQKLL